MIRLEVAVAAPLHNTLTYLFKSNDHEEKPDHPVGFYIGKRVLVPLGRRLVTGYVLGSQPDIEVSYSLKNVREILDTLPLFHANIIPFFRWVANYYHHPIGDVISTALPAGLKTTSRKCIHLTPTSLESLSQWPYEDLEEPEWFNEIVDKGQLGVSLTKDILGKKKHNTLISRLLRDKIISVESQLSADLVKEKTEICFSTPLRLTFPENITEVNRQQLNTFSEQIGNKFNQSLKFSEVKTLYYHAKLAEKNDGEVPQREILHQYKGATKPLKELVRLGLVEKFSKRVYRNPFGEIVNKRDTPQLLTEEQNTAVAEVKESITRGVYKTFLLHGITGSGKTEVYLRASEKSLERSKDILVLVPEIALATQLESHFVSRFGELVVLLHSGLSAGEKYDQWSLAASGKAKIVIGARSAVFAPLENIGLIVVDEEHDAGFKQDDGLKYNGRDLAILRAKYHDATIVLGSATPSITSYHNAINGKYSLLNMTKRVGKSLLPKVEVIDLKKVGVAKKGVFHERFKKQLEHTLLKNEQGLILLNRRGFSTSYICQDCGTSINCEHCNVSLTYHKSKEILICHYCGYSVSSKLICSNCNSEKLIPFGFGTERIEEELSKSFPEAKIARLDSDTAANRKKFLQILQSMHNQEIDILIGTQMIAKGHHFPNVTFVGVVWADGGLNMPDFRAAERTFQLLSQVTGRAGRGDKKGRVFIQTMRPNHYAIELARTHRYEEFYQREINIRKRPVFPPYVRLACLKLSGDTDFNVKKTAKDVVGYLKAIIKAKEYCVDILGPATAPIEKIHDRYRWQILLKSDDISHLHTLCSCMEDMRKKLTSGKTEIVLDIDPENMM